MPNKADMKAFEAIKKKALAVDKLREQKKKESQAKAVDLYKSLCDNGITKKTASELVCEEFQISLSTLFRWINNCSQQ